jgi:hypothetical protein
MSEANKRLEAGAAEKGADAPERVRCEFEHPFFLYFHNNGGGHFRFDEVTGHSAFVVRMGERLEYTLPVPQLAAELGLHDADTADSRRLRLAAEAVSFVDTLDLGAELPSEVVTGKASWSVPEPFLRLARATIGARISDWLARGCAAGLEPPPGIAETLAALRDDEGSSGAKHRLTPHTEQLVEEFAYMLCLRHRWASALAALRSGVGTAASVFTPQSPRARPPPACCASSRPRTSGAKSPGATPTRNSAISSAPCVIPNLSVPAWRAGAIVSTLRSGGSRPRRCPGAG